MKKSIISLFLVLSIIVTLGLGGCVKGKDATTDPSSTITTTQDEEKVDPPVKLTVMAQDNTVTEYPITGPKGAIQLALEKMANVDITWETAAPGEQFVNLVKTRLAAGTDLPDIMSTGGLNNNELFNLATNNIMIPLNDLIDNWGPNIKRIYWEEKPSALKASIFPDGKLYWLGYIMGESALGMSGAYSTAMIRVDWLEKVGIDKMPETIDELYYALKMFQEKDANGNGKKDEVLRAVGLGRVVANTSNAFGIKDLQWTATASFTEVNGKVINSWVMPETKEYVQWMSKLFKEGLADPESFTMGWDKFNAKASEDTLAFTTAGAWSALANTKTFGKDVPGLHFRNLHPLKGLNGQDPVHSEGVITPEMPTFITKDCKNPEAAIRFLDTCMSVEGFEIISMGIEGVHWTRNAKGKPEFTQEYFDKCKANPIYQQTPEMGKNIYSSVIKNMPDEDEAQAIKNLDTVFPGDGLGTPEAPYLRAMDAAFNKVLQPAFKVGVSTKEENEKLESVSNDLWVYIDEMAVKFVSGQEPIENWDAYVEQANSLGLNKATEVYQSMRERWNSVK